MPQFASYPLITSVAANDLLLVHQDSTGVEKTVKYSDLVSSGYVINVKAYGAVGNGTTDDSAAVQAAFNAAVYGSVILFPATSASYVINTPITVPISNITIVGYGATLSNTSDTQYRKFTISGSKSFIKIEGLVFNGGYSGMATNYSNGTISITNSSQISIDNCYFLNTNAPGITVVGNSIDISVTNCKFFQTFSGISTGPSGGNNPYNINISNNFFRNSLGSYSAAYSGAVIMVNSAPMSIGAGVTITNNEIRSFGKHGVNLNTALHNSVIANNYISGAGVGIELLSSTGVVITGNTIRDAVNEGILVQLASDNVNVSGNVVNTTDSNSNGIKFNGITRGTISDNNVQSNGDGLVIIDSPSATITGNTFRSTGEQVAIIIGGLSTISNFVLSGNSLIAAGGGTRYHIKLDSTNGVINNGLITSNFFSGNVLDAGINLYAPGGNSINDINITANNTTNTTAASGKLLDFGGTANPAVVLNRIWCSGNTGQPNNLAMSFNVDYYATSSSISMPYVWFVFQNGTIGMDSSGGARSVELPPSADYPGWRVTIIKTDSSTNAVTITGYGGTQINGQASYVLRAQGESVTLVNGVTQWRIENAVNRSYTMVYRGSNQSIPNLAETDIVWVAANYNGANAWSNANPERLYVPSGAKKVRLSFNFRWAYNATGTRRIIRIKTSGGAIPVWATFAGAPAGIVGAFGTSGSLTTPIIKVSDLPSGSAGYFYVTAEQDSGGALDIYGNFEHTNFQIEVIE